MNVHISHIEMLYRLGCLCADKRKQNLHLKYKITNAHKDAIQYLHQTPLFFKLRKQLKYFKYLKA